MPGEPGPTQHQPFLAQGHLLVGGWLRITVCARRGPPAPHLPDLGIYFSYLLVTTLCPESALIEELSNRRWKKPKGMKVTALYSLLRAF